MLAFLHENGNVAFYNIISLSFKLKYRFSLKKLENDRELALVVCVTSENDCHVPERKYLFHYIQIHIYMKLF